MKTNTRKLALTTHITLSGGWIGSALAYLGLVVVAMTSPDEQTLLSVWTALDLVGWYVIVPLAVAAFVTGLLMALGTSWGLVRHYWILASLVLTVMASSVLLLHMPTVSSYARIAVQGQTGDLAALRNALRGELLHAGLGVVVLLAIQTLNVYKPRGLTAFGRRVVVTARIASAHQAARVEADTHGVPRTPVWVRAVWIHAGVLVLIFAILHVAGGGLPRH